MNKQLLTLCVLVLSLFSIMAKAQPTAGLDLPGDVSKKGGYNIYCNGLAETSTFMQAEWQFANWGGDPSEYTGIAGNPCELVANFRSVGIQGQALDLSNVEKLCLSVWSDEARTINVYIINSANITGTKTWTEASIVNNRLTAGSWTTLELPVATFKTNNNAIDLTQIDQIKLDKPATGPSDENIYIDNVYFQFANAAPFTYPSIPNYATIVPIFTSGSYTDRVSA